jgi:uncharacterized protein YutE (UPF0331/DUF86 family)
VNPPRSKRSAEQLRESYEETLDALRSRFEQLEAAVAQFEPDLDEQAFSAAWNSGDPLERNRADNVLSSFEKTYMLIMDLITLSVKLARRLGVLDVDERLSPLQVLRELKVLSRSAEEALDVEREVRNASQHVYVELEISDVRKVVAVQLESSPRIVQSITAWVEATIRAAERSQRHPTQGS